MNMLLDSSKESNSTIWFWISLIIPLYFGLVSLVYALGHPYVVQDDVRLHVVWLQRYVDPQLFPNDVIANYFPTLAPDGFKITYWLATKIGIEPRTLANFLPTGLAIATTIYTFKLTLTLFPVPAAAFLSSLILNQNLWLNDDLISATPRAFVYPCLAAFLYYMIVRRIGFCLIAMALTGLFYPQVLLVEVLLLTLRLWNGEGSRLPQISLRRIIDNQNCLIWVAGLSIALPLILIFALRETEFEPLVTVEQMKALPEFNWRGRNQYFGVNPFHFLFRGDSSFRFPLLPLIIWSSFGLPLITRTRSSWSKLIQTDTKVLYQVGLASFIMTLLAHLLLLKLYLPSRYSYPSIRFVMAIAAGIVVFIWLEKARAWLSQNQHLSWSLKQTVLVGLCGLAIFISTVVPAIPAAFIGLENWRVSQVPQLHQFLAAQPKDTLVASLAEEADNIPAFAERSTLVGEEFALAYHPKYYALMEQRVVDLVHAQYGTDLTAAKQMIQAYGIDYFLIESTAFELTYLLSRDWFMYSSFTPTIMEAIASLQKGNLPAFARLESECAVFTLDTFNLLDANCILKQP